LEVRRYLNRVGYKGSVKPTLDVLRRLHRQHMLTVPFENLDIHLGRPIILDTRLFYRKIVEERRGGYCYELNGCFAWLLKRIGFKVSTLSARVARRDGGFTPEFDHMTLLVSLGSRLLVDVGFGDSFTEPKSIDAIDSRIDHGYFYRVSKKNTVRILSRRSDQNTSWQTQYAFSLRRRRLSEFAARNRYQQTSPDSHFTRQPLISKLTRSGRITLTDSKLITTRNQERVERKLKSRDEFNSLLAKYFQMELGETTT
jgi:N-hydroxyarylamine O-acetyltransferase